jgi:hypothetical protein
VIDLKRLEKYDVDDLAAMETLCRGQADDLKCQTDNVRWWLTRCEESDHPIMVEICIMGRWEEVHAYGDWEAWRKLDEESDDDQVE